MSAHEQLQPAPTGTMPADPNVLVPEHVRRAAEQADAIHKAAYTNLEAQGQTTPSAPAAPNPEITATVTDPAPHQEPAHQPAPAPVRDDQNVSAEEWRHRFLSMQGRYQAAQRDHGAMEQQLQQLGQELVRTQELVGQLQSGTAVPTAQTRHDHGNLITDEDRANYGDELIDLARRSALSAVTPELQQLRAENERLTQRVRNTGKRELFATLDGAIPNWRAINNDPTFTRWLRLPNVYTGQIRHSMLKAAVDGAEAPKAIALFRDFLAEAAATGQSAPAPQLEQRPPQEAPRQPAVDLETLAAPGKGRPASGDSQVPVEKPVYTRAQISKFFDDKRRGLYAGRDAEVAAYEADLSLAQREGRIR